MPGKMSCGRHVRNRDDPVGVAEGEGLEQHGVDDAEDRRVRPDPEREDDDRGGRESRALGQDAQPVSNVLPELCHRRYLR